MTRKPILVLTSGAIQVDAKKLGDLVHAPPAKADADFVRAKAAYVIATGPPIGHLVGPISFIDEDLLQYTEVWAAVGTANSMFPLLPQALQVVTKE